MIAAGALVAAVTGSIHGLRWLRPAPRQRRSRATRLRSVAIAILLAGLPVPVAAQDVRPGEERPALPDFQSEAEDGSDVLDLPDVPPFEPPESERGSTLPRLELPSDRDTEGLAAGTGIQLQEVRIVGNTALDPEVLSAIARAYLDQPLSHDRLRDLRDELTLAFVSRGYVTSGVWIPQQSLEDGVLEIRVIEGRLTGIEVHNEGRLREGYVEHQIERRVTTPLDVNELERALQILQQDERIDSVHATLEPGESLGEAVLQVRVLESRAWDLELAGNNYSSPVIGEWRGVARASHRNLTGFGDWLQAEYRGGEALQDVRGSWEVASSRFGTRIEGHLRLTWSEVVEEPFDALDIRSRTQTYGFTLTHPLYRDTSKRVDAFLIGEWRESESFIFGDEPFSFVLGPIAGVGRIAALRFGTSATYSTRTQALAARGVLSWGLDALGATTNGGDTPDGQFLAFLGQLQWARRLPWLDSQLVGRMDLQVAESALLGLEQFSIGGHASVRGYRENTLVTDNGFVASLELRVPVPMPSFGNHRPRLEIAPFFDIGHAWNTDRTDPEDQTLAGIGIGGRLGLHERAHFQVYWGHPLLDGPDVGDSGLQDDGVSLGMTWDW